MLTSYQKMEHHLVLNDLIKINNDRISCYEQALNANVDADLRKAFGEIIAEAQTFNKILASKLGHLAAAKNTITLSGLIHRAWMELKITLMGCTRNAIINFCLYNEEIAMQSYAAALNVSEKLDSHVTDMIETQHLALKKNHTRIKSYHQARRYNDAHVSYQY